MLRLLMLGGVVLPWLVNLASADLVARTEGAVVTIKLAILVVVIAAGAGSVQSEALATDTWPGLGGIVGAAMLIFVAYEGFELIANASEDVVAPERTLPWAFGLSVGLVMALYVAIAIVVVGSLSPATIAASQDFALAESAKKSLGVFGFRLVAGSAMLATLSAINATLYGAARLSATLATEGELPERFEHLRWRQPIGLHVTAAGGAIIAVSFPLQTISGVASAIFLVVFAAVNLAAVRAPSDLVVLRRPISAVGTVGCIAALVMLLVRSSGSDPIVLVVLASLLAVALLVEHRLLRPRRGGSLTVSVAARG